MSSLLSLMGWSFLPNLVTGWVQTVYYGITVRAGDPRPRPGTPRWAEHRRRIHVLVVSLYLAYTAYEAYFELRAAGSYYADLGVPLAATEREVKARFRRLAALYHPDKAAAAGADPAGAHYMRLKAAAEALSDPARRFAYDRFGPEAAGWPHCRTARDFVLRGAQGLLPYYALAAAAMYALGLLGYLAWGAHWRWLTLASLLAFELHAVTRPAHPAVLARLVNPLLARLPGGPHPPLLPFQAVSLARRLGVTLHIAFSQVGPLLAADTSQGRVEVRAGGGGGGSGGDEAALRQGLERLDAVARGLDTDAGRLLDMELMPFAGDAELQATLRGKMRDWLVQNTIRSDPMVRDALGRLLRKRRVDAPAGARGTR